MKRYIKMSTNVLKNLFITAIIISVFQLFFSSTVWAEEEKVGKINDIKSEQAGTGIVINGGKSGEVYGGQRWPNFEDKKNWLSIKSGEGGIRIITNDGKSELLAMDNFGGIYFSGDLYLNGKKVNDILSKEYINKDDTILLLGGMLLFIFTVLIITIFKLRKDLYKLKSIINSQVNN